MVFAGLVEEDCVAKMRLLSLVDLASNESGKIPYASIKNTLQVMFFLVEQDIKTLITFFLLLIRLIKFVGLQVNDEEVELWVVKAITAKLVDCKMDQMNQLVIVRQVLYASLWVSLLCV